jgi:hypothetical protein
MKRRPNLTEDERAEIVRLREKGWGIDRLAEHFKCSPGSISWCCTSSLVLSLPVRNTASPSTTLNSLPNTFVTIGLCGASALKKTNS